ncbi:ABC transporter substrate-binding protein [Piscinibacter terrae]|uniref:ABC transporter substrate-binding protein n=1 Tax=Piscinibacter terrae TaxID=2496871 RepID=A0A3N7HI82_9BURK|nr:ABC transporter substrate-binding protein [Albitalea terrae]RQP21213.1 ABC transporter substrate-binding protein [Albitalea terrae]
MPSSRVSMLRWWCLGLLLAAAVGHAQPLKVAVSRGPVSLPLYVAESNQYFKATGVDVVFVPCKSGLECFELMSSGAADVATAAELVLSLRAGSHPESVLLGTLSSSAHQIKLVARRDAGIARPQDVQGKTVATVMGTSAQYFMSSWLTFHGLGSSDVKLVATTPSDVVQTLATRRADAVAIWEPLASTCVQELGGRAAIIPSPRVYTQFFSLLSTRQAVTVKSQALTRFLQALIKAEHFIEIEPQRARDILRTQLGGSTELADRLMSEQDYHLRLDQAVVTTMRSQVRWARKENLVSSSDTDPATLVDAKLLRALMPQAVTLVDR